MRKGRVALVKGDDRYTNVAQALEAIGDDIDLEGKERITIKPNFVSVRRAACATHRDAVRAVLDILRDRGASGVTLTAGPALGSTRDAIKNYGYDQLVKKYGLRVVDLNNDDAVEVQVLDRDLKPLTLRVARTMIESDYRISVNPPKTHDFTIVTLSLKNMAVGGLLRGNKSRIHQNFPAFHVNLYKMARHVAPHLSVIDGMQGMEGDGPVSGDPVDWGMAIASTDFLAADALASHLMGFPLEQVGYLLYCHQKGLGQGDVDKMDVVGNARPEDVQRQFTPHTSYEQQRKWHLEGVERYL